MPPSPTASPADQTAITGGAMTMPPSPTASMAARRKELMAGASVAPSSSAASVEVPSSSGTGDPTPSSTFGSDQTAVTGGAMTVREFCKWASVGKTTLYSQAKSGRITLRKIGGRTLILRSDAEAWLRALPTVAA